MVLLLAHDSCFLVLSHSLLKEVCLSLERYVLHEIKRIHRVVFLQQIDHFKHTKFKSYTRKTGKFKTNKLVCKNEKHSTYSTKLFSHQGFIQNGFIPIYPRPFNQEYQNPLIRCTLQGPNPLWSMHIMTRNTVSIILINGICQCLPFGTS